MEDATTDSALAARPVGGRRAARIPSRCDLQGRRRSLDRLRNHLRHQYKHGLELYPVGLMAKEAMSNARWLRRSGAGAYQKKAIVGHGSTTLERGKAVYCLIVEDAKPLGALSKVDLSMQRVNLRHEGNPQAGGPGGIERAQNGQGVVARWVVVTA